LNILAEILRFGDREFYKDWWNAKTIDEYWRKWNMVCLSFLLSISTFSTNVLSDVVYTVGLNITI